MFSDLFAQGKFKLPKLTNILISQQFITAILTSMILIHNFWNHLSLFQVTIGDICMDLELDEFDDFIQTGHTVFCVRNHNNVILFQTVH